MILNPFVFLIGRTIARNNGVPDGQATTDGFAASIVKPPVLGLVLVSALAKSQAQSLTRPAAPPVTVVRPPVINDMSATTGAPGSALTLDGANFGSTQGSSAVTIDGRPLFASTKYVSAWSDTSITITIPGASYFSSMTSATGSANPPVSIRVRVNGVDSNPVFFTII